MARTTQPSLPLVDLESEVAARRESVDVHRPIDATKINGSAAQIEGTCTNPQNQSSRFQLMTILFDISRLVHVNDDDACDSLHNHAIQQTNAEGRVARDGLKDSGAWMTGERLLQP
jgi:hypothetical protein